MALDQKTGSDLQSRFDRVITHIDDQMRNEDQYLSLDDLAKVAAYSPFHFHRQFTALYDMTVSRYVRLLRLQRAAHALLYRKNRSITDIAFDVGYENAESFSRAFRKLHKQSPSTFRVNPNWDHWQTPYAPLAHVRRKAMNSTNNRKIDDVTIIEMTATITACLDHVGAPSRIGETIQRFIAWRKTHHLHPSKHATFNILRCNPDDTPPDEFRMGLAVVTSQDLTTKDKEAGFYSITLPAGRYARLRHIGSDTLLDETVLHLYRDWLPNSAETPGDFPLLFQRIAFYPDVREHEAITDVLLPLA